MANEIPKPPAVGAASVVQQYARVDWTLTSHMSQTQSETMIRISEIEAAARVQVSKNERAIPARQETLRACGPIILAGLLLLFLVPRFLATNDDPKILAYVIVIVIGIVAAGPTAKAVIQAIKGS
jgi:hypothetical protein